MAAPGFRENAKLYDQLLIAGIQVPGEWTCPQLSRALDIKHPKSDGKDEGSIRVAGLLPTEGVISIKLDTDEEEREWERLIARVFPLDKPSSRNVVTIDNPIFKRLGIRLILVTGIDNPVPDGGDPQACAIHWRSAKQPGGKPKTRKPEGIELRPNAFTDPTPTRPNAGTPAQQAKAAGGR